MIPRSAASVTCTDGFNYMAVHLTRYKNKCFCLDLFTRLLLFFGTSFFNFEPFRAPYERTKFMRITAGHVNKARGLMSALDCRPKRPWPK